MNRKEKRKLVKLLKAKGNTDKEIERMLMIKAMIDSKKDFKEGQHVKLNVSQMMAHPDWPKLTDKYKRWVKEHVDSIFTIEYDMSIKENPSLVCLKEDENKPKWLFWEGNLIEVEESKDKYRNSTV